MGCRDKGDPDHRGHVKMEEALCSKPPGGFLSGEEQADTQEAVRALRLEKGQEWERAGEGVVGAGEQALPASRLHFYSNQQLPLCSPFNGP